MSADLCAFVDTWLDDWLAGRLPADVTCRIEAHVAACERCRRLAAIVMDAETGTEQRNEAVDLIAPVLDRTSGPACARAEQLLPALADNELDAESREILRDHLSHCDACTRLLAVVEESRELLPTLVELPVPPGFAQRVFAATSRRERPSPFVEWWLRVLARPRASLELAYVATVLLVVLLGNPVAAFQHARDGAGRLAAAVPVAQVTDQLAVRSQAAGVVGRMLTGVTSIARVVANELASRLQQVAAWIDAIRTSVGDALRWIATADAWRLLRDLRELLVPQERPAPQEQPVKK